MEKKTLRDMIGDLYHGHLGYGIIFVDKKKRTITDGADTWHRQSDETQKQFVKRAKKLALETCEGDKIITISN